MLTERWRESWFINSWTFIGLAATILVLTRGTQFEQFGIGLLTASVALLVAMIAFEMILMPVLRPLCGYLEEKFGTHALGA